MEREVGLQRREPRRDVADLMLERVDLRRQAADLRAEVRLLRLRARDLRVQLRRASRRPAAFWSPRLSPAKRRRSDERAYEREQEQRRASPSPRRRFLRRPRSAARSLRRLRRGRLVRRRIRLRDDAGWADRLAGGGSARSEHHRLLYRKSASESALARASARRARRGAPASRASSSVEPRADRRLGRRVAARARPRRGRCSARAPLGLEQQERSCGCAAPRPPRPGARAASPTTSARARARRRTRGSRRRVGTPARRLEERGERAARRAPSRISPNGQWPVAKRTIAKTNATTATPSRSCGGATPNQCGSLRCSDTGTGPVSFGGTCSRTVEPASTCAPHAGQNRALAGSPAPQFGQVSAATGDALMPRFCPRLERT